MIYYVATIPPPLNLHCPNNTANFQEYKGGSPWRGNFPVTLGNDAQVFRNFRKICYSLGIA
jgi:hypothetical protein